MAIFHYKLGRFPGNDMEDEQDDSLETLQTKYIASLPFLANENACFWNAIS